MDRFAVIEIGYVVVAGYLATWLLIAWRLRSLRASLEGAWARVEIFSPDIGKTFHALRTLYSPTPRDAILVPLAWLNRLLFPVGAFFVAYSFATIAGAD